MNRLLIAVALMSTSAFADDTSAPTTAEVVKGANALLTKIQADAYVALGNCFRQQSEELKAIDDLQARIAKLEANLAAATKSAEKKDPAN